VPTGQNVTDPNFRDHEKAVAEPHSAVRSPIVASRCIDRLFYDIPRIAPQIVSDFTPHTSSARTDEDLVKLIASWAETWGLRPEWLLSLYPQQPQKTCTAIEQDDPSVARSPVPVHIHISECFMWPAAKDPTASTFCKWALSTIKANAKRQLDTAIARLTSDRQRVSERQIARGSAWFIRYHILRNVSFSEIGRTAKKFLEDELGEHPKTCDRGTIARHVTWFAHQLGVVLRPPDRGGRPTGRRDSKPRHKSQKNL